MRTLLGKLCFIYFLLLPLWAMAFTLPFQDNTIRLQATGEVAVTPDRAVLTIAVTTENAEASLAIADNAQKMNQVVEVLRKAIPDETKIQTNRFQLNPIMQYDQQTQRNYTTGYRVTNEVIVQYDNLGALGALIDNVVAVGSNDIQQLTFTRSDIDALQDQALQMAIANGIVQADLMAKAASVKVTHIKEINTYLTSPDPGPVYGGMLMKADANTPILPGEMKVSQTIYMTFGIE